MSRPSQRATGVKAGVYRTYLNYRNANTGVHVYPNSHEVPQEMARIATKFREFWTMNPTESYRHPLVAGSTFIVDVLVF